MADENTAGDAEGGGNFYDTFIWVLRGYVQWLSLAVGGLTCFIFWTHWLSAVGDYGAKQSADFPSVTTDTNAGWRTIFSLRPEVFVDKFTPLCFGLIEVLQHLSPQYQNTSIAGTWVVRAIWFFVMSLFGMFGYAGNLGVYCGYFTDFGLCAPCIALAILDHESVPGGKDGQQQVNQTTAEALPMIDAALSLCGLNVLCPGLTAVQKKHSLKPEQPVVGGSA